MASISISGDLIAHVRTILELSLLGIPKGSRGARQGINAYSTHALPAYICAVASVESFINENLLAPFVRGIMKDSPLWDLPSEWREDLEIRKKLILVPQLLFGSSFKRHEQPFQDISTLVKIRNDLVHYKMDPEAPKYIGDLEQKGIVLRAPAGNGKGGGDFPWAAKLSCTEGIRWAHNTACLTVQGLLDLVSGEARPFVAHSAKNFKGIISEEHVISRYREQGIDPTSNDPNSIK